MARRKRLPPTTRLTAVWETTPINVTVGTANTSKPVIHISAREKNGVKIDSMTVSFHSGCGSMLRQVKNKLCKGARASADVEFRTNTGITEGPKRALLSIRLHKKNTTRARYRDAVTPHAEYTEEIISVDTRATARARRRATVRKKASHEYVIVRFPESRTVRVDGVPGGLTNKVLQVERGRHTFTLEGVKNYEPTRRRPLVMGTTTRKPMEVHFEKL
jgi:hypothetical protein